MAVLGWIVVWICLLPVVRGDYNCSKSSILETLADDFRENMKHACENLNVWLYKQKDRKMNLTATSDATNLMVRLWGECDVAASEESCRDCVNDLTSNLVSVCNNSSWGELTMVLKGKNVCFVHYSAVDYIDDAPSTLIQSFRHSLLFFLLWHLLMFLYMCLK